MKKTTNKNYIPLAILIAVIFILYTAIRAHSIVSYSRFDSLDYRLERMKSAKENDHTLLGPSLASNDDYEVPFDEYWSFVEIEDRFLQGCTYKRAIHDGDTSKQAALDETIQFIQHYVNNSDDYYYRIHAQKFVDKLKSPTII